MAHPQANPQESAVVTATDEVSAERKAELEQQAASVALDFVKERRLEISEAGLKRLAAYKYKSGAYTPLDTFLNTHVWIPLSECIPHFLAPNAITLLGLIFMVTGTIVVSYFSPDLRATAPWWAYAYAAFSIFAYQTLDALDGKQARRTGSSSPLGQLFDHGCDSASTTFLCLIGGTCLRLGFGRSVVFLFTNQLPVWFAQWAEYHTHVLQTSVGGLAGVTEVQFLFIGIALVSMYDSSLWKSELGVAIPQQFCHDAQSSCSLQWNDVVLLLNWLASSMCLLSPLFTVMSSATANKGRAVLQLIPICFMVALGCAWAVVLPRSHPRMVMLSFGATFTFVTTKMIVAAMSQTEYQTFHTILIPLPMLFVASWLELCPRHNDSLVGAYTAFCVYKTFKYVRNVIEELSHYLGIYVFVLGRRGERQKVS